MNEEYLWNKQGEDAGIERLENALKAFRCKETAPPAIFSKNPDFQENRPHRWFPFAIAFAASAAALILIALFLSFSFSGNEVNEAKVASEISAPETKEKTVLENTIRKPTKVPVEKVEFVKPKVFTVSQAKSLTQRSPKQIARKTQTKKPAATKLTDEEKYAYGQLMLALSITNSKLNIVKDKMKILDDITVSKSER